MTFESMISFTETDGNPITEFSDSYKKIHPDWIKLIEEHKDEIAIIHGQGFKVKWTQTHDCDCDLCEIEEENNSKFFASEEEAENFVDELKECPIDNWDIKKKSDKYFIKAVKQVPVENGLF